ncbi:hypothetical protein H4K36_36020 [Streptomyces sp. DHE7-1]|nr:hypothetical protein [Streptomyces sp. DHE7-1]
MFSGDQPEQAGQVPVIVRDEQAPVLGHRAQGAGVEAALHEACCARSCSVSASW